ncbi:MAG TPA: guanylate kinase [Acidimicrobiales bacterium]|nr:guanylate kinase [Acidimicrobiales bacterium]
MLVVSGPGGAGKGTVVARLVERDPTLWLSRSWTTRARRPGETDDDYTFVDRRTFEENIARGGFLEWAEFLGNLYGTPVPDPPPGTDVLLEIDLQGAVQVRARHPEAVVVLLVPPSPEAQAERLRGRGDPEDTVAARIAKGEEEMRIGRTLTPYVVVNDDLESAVSQVAGIIDAHRSPRPAVRGGGPPEGA